MVTGPVLVVNPAHPRPEPTSGFSGHSTRVGAAQDMLRYGEMLPAIIQTGRRKTAEMVGRYTAKQGARRCGLPTDMFHSDRRNGQEIPSRMGGLR
jgi:hypothetical protein